MDRRESRSSPTGGYELAHRSPALPEFRCIDSKLVTEGSKIRKVDLQKYAQLDRKATRLANQVEKRQAEHDERKRKEEDKNSDKKVEDDKAMKDEKDEEKCIENKDDEQPEKSEEIKNGT